jgi:carbamoyl-phosphate synthase large subunit
MPKTDYKKIAIIGSGPIIIGQAAEFDYAGTQAVRAIREEGIETVLINSNPATIMTDVSLAGKVYIEPLTKESLLKILAKEKPDALLAGFGGQTGLNLAIELEAGGDLARLGVKLIGVNKESIKKAEDREEFKNLMLEIGEPIPKSVIAESLDDCLDFVRKEDYPVIIRPAYTLGGTGGGIAENEDELRKFARSGLENSRVSQILLERSVAGWKEIEFEVMRDAADECITVCGMENLDPVGIHTGDSIVVCPIQTLRDFEYQKLRAAALKIIRALKIEGGCNVQFAMHPKTGDYIVIEVNPRVSRSSALASKAAGYPIAKLAAKIAIGHSLAELKNEVTKKTSALFEPTLDYCVVKFPKWPFDKFGIADRDLGTQMKATGEVMAISRSFESAFLKAVTSLELKMDGLRPPKVVALGDAALKVKLAKQDDERVFVIAELLRRRLETVESLNEKTMIDNWFLQKVKSIVDMEERLEREVSRQDGRVYPSMETAIAAAEIMGFTESEIERLSGLAPETIREIRERGDIFPIYKTVDTCGGEFEAKTPYFYSCYGDEDEAIPSDREKILIVGSGPIRIGQGIEFDYACVQGVRAITRLGYEAIIINNNPETVSTDFDVSDRLYFEPLHIDDVMNVVRKEKPTGVILQFGGQTSLNLADGLLKKGVKILGTAPEDIDRAEDREKMNEVLSKLGILSPDGAMVTTKEEAEEAVGRLGYPVVVRPSYVIGGRAMQVVYGDRELYKYLKEAVSLSKEHPVLIDKYIKGVEMEIDAISDGEDILIPGIMEHVEKTGVHSGDSVSVYPPVTLPEEIKKLITRYSEEIARELKIVGLMNIQFAYDGKDVYIIEVNPRGSRTIPIMSKVTGVPMVSLAVSVICGKKLRDLGHGISLQKESDFYAVKVPVFSSAKLAGVDISLGPEMRSTGEVLGIAKDFNLALYKAFLASGVSIPTSGGLFVSLRKADEDAEALAVLKAFSEYGFTLYAPKKTASFLSANDTPSTPVDFQTASDMIGASVGLIINTPEIPNEPKSKGFPLRRKAIEWNLPVLTTIDTARVFLEVIKMKRQKVDFDVRAVDEW